MQTYYRPLLPAQAWACPLAIILACVLTAPLPAGAQALEGPLSLSQALQLAGENRDVAIARSALDAARSDILSANHAPLPSLSLKASQIDLQNGIGGGPLLSDKRIDKSLGLDWTWERGDKRALRTQAAQSLAGAAQQDLLETRLQQQLAALTAYHELHAAEAREQEVSRIADGAQAMVHTMGQRLVLGDLSAQDLSRAEIDAERARLDVANARLEHQRAAQALRALLGPSSAPASRLQTVDAWPSLALAEGATPPPLDQAVALRNDVQAAQQRVQAAETLLDSALAQRKSDVTWGVSLDHYPGTSTRMLELRLQMPLQLGGLNYQQEGEIGRARAQLQQAEDALAKTQEQAALDLQGLWRDAQAAAARVDSQERLILPRARQVLAQAELAYAKGALPLTDLLEARRSLRASLVDGITARAEHAKALGAWQLRSAASP